VTSSAAGKEKYFCFLAKEALFWQHCSKSAFLFVFSSILFNTASSAAPQIPLGSADAGIERRTVATLAMALDALTTRLLSHPFVDEI
jgi:hypothetical protein